MNLVCVVSGDTGATKLAPAGYWLNASKSETRTEVHMPLRGSSPLGPFCPPSLGERGAPWALSFPRIVLQKL